MRLGTSGLFFASLFALACASTAPAAAPDPSRIPLAIRNVPPERLSSAAFNAFYGSTESLTDASAASDQRASTTPVSAALPYASSLRNVTLDPRVGHNWVLESNPPEFTLVPVHHAEPHLARAAGLTLGTVQTGRKSDGGASAVSYALSRDGGYTWIRGLLPSLTQANGGPYVRATDPVAAVDSDGVCYVNTLAARAEPFELGVVALSRSTSVGGSADAPTISWRTPIIAYTAPNSTIFPDKNWMAVNNYIGSKTARRVAITYTQFTSDAKGNSTGNNAVVLLSDDQGTTWTTPIEITPAGSQVQGTQPIFLSDGSLFCAYYNFTGAGSLQCKRSLDGGRTWPASPTTILSEISLITETEFRNGSFLPSAAIARDTGTLFLTMTAVVSGTPRVFVIRSTDSGASWSNLTYVNDTPNNYSVFNPTISASADGQTVVVTFYDKRNAPNGAGAVDLYAALSFDGGLTWRPNLRVSSRSSEARNAQETSRGYMLGDYLGLVPPAGTDEGFSAIWCDTSNGQSDLMAAQIIASPLGNYTAWRSANFSAGQRAATASFDVADHDADGLLTWQEYAYGTDPRQTDGPTVVNLTNRTATSATLSHPLRIAGDVSVSYQTSTDVSNWAVAAGGPASLSAVPANPLLRTASVGVSYGNGEFRMFRPYIQIGTTGFADATHHTSAVVNSNSRLINISTRGLVGTGSRQLIAGFVVSGGTKSLLIRASGPSLASLGVSGPVPNPTLALYPNGASTASISNDNWPNSSEYLNAFSRLGAYPFSSSLESAVLTSISGANTAIVSDATGQTGVGLVEVYDADTPPGSTTGAQLINLSTRGFTGLGEQLLIAGLVIRGDHPRRVLIRAIGPGLGTFGVSGVVLDPQLKLYGGARSSSFAANDNWAATANPQAVADAMSSAGAFPLGETSKDAALVVTLEPGAYTATVTGANNSTGIALVELYDL